MQAVELFSGIGVSALGVVAAGIELVGAFEIERSFVRAFNQQSCGVLPPVARCRDVEAAEAIRGAEVVCAGPVCKAFSPAATVFGTRGEEDDRNTFPAMFNYVRRALPRYLLIENSFGLGRFEGFVGTIRAALEDLGYHVEHREIDCLDYGVPQHRRRLVFTASRRRPWKIPGPTRAAGDPRTLADVLAIPAPADDPWPLVQPLSEKAVAYMERDPRHFKKHPPLRPDFPASTVVAVYRKGVPYGVVALPDGLYHCYPRLAARLQGIPDSYSLASLSRTRALEAIGNGFPAPVVRALLSRLPE